MVRPCATSDSRAVWGRPALALPMSLCHGKYIDSSARTGTRARARVDLLPRKKRLLITLQRRASAAPLAFFFSYFSAPRRQPRAGVPGAIRPRRRRSSLLLCLLESTMPCVAILCRHVVCRAPRRLRPRRSLRSPVPRQSRRRACFRRCSVLSQPVVVVLLQEAPRDIRCLPPPFRMHLVGMPLIGSPSSFQLR